MKKVLFLVVINFLIFCSSNIRNTESQSDCYFITKIIEENGFYVIYAKNHLGSHKILSKKVESKCFKKIKIGNTYCFETKSIFNVKMKQNDTIITIKNHVNIDCITIADVSFCKEYENEIYDVLMTEELNGLCLK